LLRGAVVASLVLLAAMAVGAERRTSKRAKPAAPQGRSVELFAAMKSKEIEVSFVPRDEYEARVTITNKTKEPLNVRLPDAFAGMPVLAQNVGGGGRGGVGGAGGQNQSMGGGMMGGGMMGGGMGMGMGGGMMNVAPEKPAKFKVATVCLEHGKKPPRASVPYEIRPLEAFTTDPQVKALMVAFGTGKLDQRSTQAAAWHLANGLSWEQLASKTIQEFGNPVVQSYFSPQEIQAAMRLAHEATVIAEAEKARDAEGGSQNKPAGESESEASAATPSETTTSAKDAPSSR
jgi:hypothetical protein